MSLALTSSAQLPATKGPGQVTGGYAPIERGPIIEIMETPGLNASTSGALLDDMADDAFERHNRETLAEIATAPEIDEQLHDARRDLRMARWRRLWTTRHIRAKVASDSTTTAEGGARRKARFRLPDAEKAFVAFVTIFLVVSLAFLLYTTSQLILTERIYPAVKVWWQAALLTGTIQTGFLMVPLTLAKCITVSRAQLLFRLIINAAAIGCAVLFLYWLWQHSDDSATRSFMARTESADLGYIATFTLNLSHIEGHARGISILGEACGAIAVKLNVDYLRGVHLLWKLAPNPERAEREGEVAERRARVIACKKERTRIALMENGYERRLRLNRARYRAFAESLSRDWDKDIHVRIRELRQQALRDARWPG